jgi:hypothetical protein
MVGKDDLSIHNHAGLPSSAYPNISRVESDEAYFGQQARAVQANVLFLLKVIREFETALFPFGEQGLMHGPLHSSIGQEAVAVGTTLGLREGDKVNSTHRAHHHFLAKALAHYAPAGFDPLTSELDEGLMHCVRKTFAEILGLAEGWCGGRGGSMHLYDRESGNIGTNAIVGGGIPIATGAAFAEHFRGTGKVALSYFGDGAVSIGAFHEGINLAVVWKLPAIFVIENNLYAQSPGWRIVAPSTPFDFIGLFNAALRSCDPVYIIEHHLLYPVKGEVPQDDLDYLVAMDKAVIRRSGRDVTVAAYLQMRISGPRSSVRHGESNEEKKENVNDCEDTGSCRSDGP